MGNYSRCRADAGARVVLELRPVGLSVSDTVRITVPEDTLVCRLGTTTE
jgi:hypothetical protein